jgi:signal transduction histidine kinase
MNEVTSSHPGCAAPQRPGRHRATAIAVAAVGSLAVSTIAGELSRQPRPAAWMLGLDVAVAALGCGLLPLMFRWPVPVAVALAALAALSPAATPLSTAGTLQIARMRRFQVALAVAGAGAGAHVVQGAWRPYPGLAFGWWLLLVAAVHAALTGWGTLAQARAALIASLRERAQRAEDEQVQRVAEARLLERTRIAREMHDVLAHRLTLLATYAGALEYRPDAPPGQLSRAAGVIRSGVHQALEELREVITVMRDDDAGGAEGGTPGEAAGGGPQPTLADLPRVVGESRDAGVLVRFDSQVADPRAVPGGLGRTAYRIVQEGLTNARKHAGGQPVEVAVAGQAGAELVIDIRNPLASDPFAPPAAPGGGMGLAGLAERAHRAGGHVDHGVTASGEFRLHASLPWPM